MNRYGQQAMRHWQDTMPERVRELPDPQVFFTRIGEDLAQAIENLARTLAGEPPPQETYIQRVQRLTMAKAEAESQILRDMLLSTR